MKKKIKNNKEKCSCDIGSRVGSSVYGFGFVGSIIYFLSTATGFWNGILGILKSIIWPAIIVYELLKYLGL